MNILPGIGVGLIRFGVTENDVIAIFGTPDLVEQCEYIEGAGDWHKTLSYFRKNICFTFDEEDDYRLGTISILGPSYFLFEKELLGKTKEEVKRIIVAESLEIPRDEKWHTDDNLDLECLDHDGLGILFWFKGGRLFKMECSYLFDSNNEDIIWP